MSLLLCLCLYTYKCKPSGSAPHDRGSYNRNQVWFSFYFNDCLYRTPCHHYGCVIVATLYCVMCLLPVEISFIRPTVLAVPATERKRHSCRACRYQSLTPCEYSASSWLHDVPAPSCPFLHKRHIQHQKCQLITPMTWAFTKLPPTIYCHSLIITYFYVAHSTLSVTP